MWRRYALVLLVLGVPGVLHAQDKLDHLLPANSQLYLRWDGVAAHQADADKLAVMKMWKGETGDFVRGLWDYMAKAGKQALAKEQKGELIVQVFDEFGGMIQSVGAKGFALGVELQSVTPFQMQTTLIFPGGAGNAKSPLSFMNLVSRLDQGGKIKVVKKGDREIRYVQAEMMYLAWWAEGKDAVWSIGTTDPTLANGQKDGLTANPLYKDVAGFKEFPAWMRGYLDLQGLLRVTNKVHPAVGPLVDALGLDTIKNVTFYSGFDGLAERAVSFTHLTPGPRKGVMKVYTGKNFALKDLPPMPADLTGFAAATADWSAGYELGIDFVATLMKTVAPFGAPDIKQSVKDFEQNNNVSINALFGALDQLTVSYAASAEGILGTGQTQMIKVKDEKKLEQELGKILQLAQNQLGGLLTVNNTKYHGATLHRLSVSDPNSGTEATKIYYTIYKGWLAVAQYPQPLKGFILRANGDLPAWKAGLKLQDKLKPFPTEFSAINISDPRPTVKFVLSLLPPLIDFGTLALEKSMPLGGKLPFKRFDISLIPNAYEATKELFPNITISTMQGDTIRTETRSSLLLSF